MQHSERTLRYTLLGGLAGSVAGLFIGSALTLTFIAQAQTAAALGIACGLLCLGLGTYRFDLQHPATTKRAVRAAHLVEEK